MIEPKDIETLVAELESRAGEAISILEAEDLIFQKLPKLLKSWRDVRAYISACHEALAMPSDIGPIDLAVGIRMRRAEADSIGQENIALQARVAELEPEAKAWRDGFETLRERERVIPCGHKIEDLIGGEGTVTKCGACLANIPAFREKRGIRLKAAIRRITVDLPNDEPNGPVEESLNRLVDALFIGNFAGGVAQVEKAVQHANRVAGELVDSMAADDKELREAADVYFGEDFTKP